MDAPFPSPPARLARRGLIAVVLAVVLFGTAAAPAGPAVPPGPGAAAEQGAPELDVVLPVLDCAELAGRELELATGDTARLLRSQVVPASETAAEHCKVSGVITPQHLFEVTLPTANWTQRYLQYGCGGFCGMAPGAFPIASAGCEPLARGELATAYGNGGHVAASATDGSWAVDRSLFEDYAYESEHQLSLAASQVMEAFYGQEPQYRYFNSCSNGGRQALVLSQRYPGDFDGIIAGAPANITVPLVIFSLGWNSRANTAADGSEIIAATDLPTLHAGALAACDELDGLVDGIITDPLDCSFDPATVQCAADGDEGCLSAEQVEAARKIYQGALDEAGAPFYPGGGMPHGSELAWAGWIVQAGPDDGVPASQAFASGWLRYMASLDPMVSLELEDLVFDTETYQALREVDAVAAADDPDLGEFRDAGGKLIIWHGWNDPAIPAQGSMAYFEAVTEAMGGADAVGEFARLYLVPGMYHCSGGDGPDQFDLLTPLMAWVEGGNAPEGVTASQLDEDGTVTRTRPVFPYPQVPVYDGAGDPDDAASFSSAPEGQHHLTWASTFGSSGRAWCQLENGNLVCSEDIAPGG
ncbi:MAG: tannase/feruloyl esterase family alpha/beta hydrolase [Acidimicrobiia bacterium]|nr:tannase/feruloyl esterase family alpha/beta hydrolase [Acidimicrobiia bacterium]